MATAAGSRAGSGGKVLRPRRVARVATPYDRPPNPNPHPANPSWISKLVLSPTRVIASGAGKLLSTVFGPESSSSSSSSGSDSDSDNEIDEDNNGIEKSSAGVDELNEERGKSETARPLSEESTNENKLLIEQLLLQETFSREECERLTSIIKSRVAEAPLYLDREVSRPSEMYNRAANTDVEMPDLCNTALMEARKWFKEKKSGSSPELDLNPSISPPVNEGETGSPVDVAKSYMKDRPPWTSPYSNGEVQRSASPIGIRLFKDDEPLSIGGNSLSSSKSQLKRDGPIIGSWNITEEIRRVRSKATEQMLRTPSTKIDLPGSKPSSSATKLDWSRSVLGYKYSLNSLAANNSEAGLGDKSQTSTKLIDALPDMPAEDTAKEPSNTTENRSDDKVPLLNPSVLISTEDRGPEDGSGDIRTVVPSDNCGADEITCKNTNGSSQLHGDIIPDTRGNDGVCSVSKEGSLTGDASVPNGLPHLTSRSNAQERDIRAYDEEQNPPISSLPPHLEETHEPQNEALLEAPNMIRNDDIATGSQNSSSVHYEEMPLDIVQQVRKPAASPKRGRKVTRYGRRGRGK